MGAPTTTAASVVVPTGSTTTAASVPSGAVALLAAGDIGDCNSGGDEATAALIAARPGVAIATLGDTVYEKGTPSEFTRCYAPNWGRFRDRTRPAPGNHDYATKDGSGYYAYFGAAAGRAGEGWYSYELGAWHVVVLNSNCGSVPCATGGAQQRWLQHDLATHPARCTLAYWHHPRFSSGLHGSTVGMADLYRTLYDAGADLVLSGHDHDYERLAPLDPSGALDAARGIRSFVVGTGGRSHYPFPRQITGSEVRLGETFGVLALTLEPTAYRWQFVPVPGRDVTDTGRGVCH